MTRANREKRQATPSNRPEISQAIAEQSEPGRTYREGNCRGVLAEKGPVSTAHENLKFRGFRTTLYQIMEQGKQNFNRAWIYIRVSTARQAMGHGLDAQLAETRGYAEARGWTIVGESSDEESGRTEAVERTGLTEAVRAAQDGGYDWLVVREISRFGRDAADALSTAKRLADAGVFVIDVMGRTSQDKLMFGILTTVAEYEADTISERAIGGKAVAASQGKYPSGAAPYGYARDAEGNLVEHPEESRAVRLAFSMAAQPDKYPNASAIADALAKRDHHWNRTTVYRRLRDPLYRGDGFTYNLTLKSKLERREFVREFVIPAPALVEPSLWRQAQLPIEQRRKRYRDVSEEDGSRIYALSGRIFHQHEDGELASMRGETRNIKGKHGDVVYDYGQTRFYRCSAAIEPDRDCSGVEASGARRVSVYADQVEASVIEWSLGIIAEPDTLGRIVGDQRRASLAVESDAEYRAALQEQLAGLPEKRERWIEQYGEGLIDREQRDRKLAAIDADAERVQAELANIEAKFDTGAFIERLKTVEIGYVPAPGEFNPSDVEWPQVDKWLRGEVEAYRHGDHSLNPVVQAYAASFVNTLGAKAIVVDRENIRFQVNGGGEILP